MSGGTRPIRIAVFGAGSIGCYVGGRLAAAGAAVSLIGRERIGNEIREHGLRLTDLRGADVRVDADAVSFATDFDSVDTPDLVIVCVKSADTAEVAATLASAIDPGSVVMSAQNGLGNADALREAIPENVVLAAMVPFNVVRRGPGHFHQGSEGDLEIERHRAVDGFASSFAAAGLPLREHDEFRAVQWAKLLLNLNNPVNALSDLPLREELSQRPFRRAFALAQREALDLLAARGIAVAKLTPLPPHWIPRLLDVPDWLFRVAGSRMLAIDPHARSSMWDDLEAGRRTEVDWISGEVVRLAESAGTDAPVNARLVTLIREAEAGGERRWTGEALVADLRAQRNPGNPTGKRSPH
ncbi:2-dehydropantoate 2-reductase [Rhodococcus sp. WMMA185]|uniref:2-dehydropantoate 2-reductase n=1 Tax=Rhodococcus sp. WMMA185 TaxID=679318 RepID=UPI000878FF3B|nr:2-dehydropantoate 2-reductase [Rhodococcus sp. WMMA185]AOW92705.1 2-dehydropantoate 2-reductase [Rhodococcus sp. WMMA185]